MNSLVIVESPAKAKTIKKYLGDGFSVMSSFGHIRDLPTKEIGIDLENNFSPCYIVLPDKKKIVSDLEKASKAADIIYLASDDDREGEAISWHLKTVLKLSDDKIKRIVFHEITEKAITNALKNPRQINMSLVDSQQARRILDRIVGYKLSPVLWKKIKSGLSAGRVQSVAVRLIVDKEREINAFNPEKYFNVVGEFVSMKGDVFSADMKKNFKTDTEVIDVFTKLNEAVFSIYKVDRKQLSRSPLSPFTTSSLQQEANNHYGYSVSQTMLLAQHLYEAGHISYMRTDSVLLSDDARQQAQEVIISTFGENYIHQRQFSTKSKLVQGAHEAIRPTHFEKIIVSDDEKEQRLYTLIRNRALASQMADAIIDKTTFTINNSLTDSLFIAKGEVVKFDGFLRVYKNVSTEDKDISLPELKEGDVVKMNSLLGKERRTQGPSRYTEASLVKDLEEKGIGRPSTYAPTISTIQTRGYVIKDSREGKKVQRKIIKLVGGKIEETLEQKTEGSEKNKLYPSDIAMVTNDFLIEHFPDITDYAFTADVEKQLDIIADGQLQWEHMLKDFYQAFLKELDNCSDTSRVEFNVRFLGVDPCTGKNIYARIAKFGPVIQVGDKDDVSKPRFVGMLKNQSVNSITLEEALVLLSFPKKIGVYQGEDIMLMLGPYGAYIKCGKVNAPIYDQSRIWDITEQEAITLIEKKIDYARKKEK